MKYFILLLSGIFFLNCSAKHASKKGEDQFEFEDKPINTVSPEQNLKTIVFQRGLFIYSCQISTKKKRKIVEGFDPSISPDGKSLAYTKYSNENREIYIIDLETNEEHKLNIEDTNFYGPVWSPDSKYIAFSIMVNSNWQIGLIQSDNRNFSILQAGPDTDIHAPAWSFDSKHILCHNLSTAFKFDLNGTVVETIDLEKTLGDDFYLTSSSKILLTADTNCIVFEAGLDEMMDNLNEPVSALFSYHFDTKKITRLTRKGLCCYNPLIEIDNTVYFSGFTNIAERRMIFKINVSDTTLIKIVDNGY